MTQFLDGPAAGRCLALRYSPLYLRVAHSPRHGWDALDRATDLPRYGETLYAYRLKDQAGSMCHVRAGKASGWYRLADYVLCEVQPDDATMRHAGKWCAWTDAQTQHKTDPRPQDRSDAHADH